MQRIGVSKTLTRFRLTAVNDVDDREVANGQDPENVEQSKGRGNGVSTHKEAEDWCVRNVAGAPKDSSKPRLPAAANNPGNDIYNGSGGK